MISLFDPLSELVMAGLDAILQGAISRRKEKSDLQKLMSRQREAHAIIAQKWAVEGEHKHLRGLDLSEAIFDKIQLADADLGEASFRNSHIKRSNLSGATLEGVDFTGAFLTNVKLIRANLGLTDFTHASLQNVDFSQANLRGANFLQVKEVKSCVWESVYINSKTQLNSEIKNRI